MTEMTKETAKEQTAEEAGNVAPGQSLAFLNAGLIGTAGQQMKQQQSLMASSVHNAAQLSYGANNEAPMQANGLQQPPCQLNGAIGGGLSAEQQQLAALQGLMAQQQAQQLAQANAALPPGMFNATPGMMPGSDSTVITEESGAAPTPIRESQQEQQQQQNGISLLQQHQLRLAQQQQQQQQQQQLLQLQHAQQLQMQQQSGGMGDSLQNQQLLLLQQQQQLQQQMQQQQQLQALQQGIPSMGQDLQAQQLRLGLGGYSQNMLMKQGQLSIPQLQQQQQQASDTESKELLSRMLNSQLTELNRLGLQPNQMQDPTQLALNNSIMMSGMMHAAPGTLVAMPNDMQTTKFPPKGSRKNKSDKKGQPKRPLTAYNLFFKEERAKLLAERAAKNILLEKEQKLHTSEGTKRERRRQPHGKIGFREMAMLISKSWKEVDPARKAAYEEQAKIDKKRYREEISKWRSAQADHDYLGQLPDPKPNDTTMTQI